MTIPSSNQKDLFVEDGHIFDIGIAATGGRATGVDPVHLSKVWSIGLKAAECTGSYTFSYSAALVDEFLSSFNVINHMHTCTNLSTTTVPDHYASLQLTSAHYKRILPEACSLVPTITNYNDFFL